MELKTYNKNLILGVVALSGIMIGSEISSMSAFIDTENFNDFFGVLSKREQTLLAASIPIGAVLGSVVCGTFCDVFGCVVNFQISNIFWVVGCGIVIMSEFIYVLILGRVFKGISIGFISCLVPVYISEVFPMNQVGTSISLFHLFSVLGTIMMYFIGFVIEKQINSFMAFRITWCTEVVPSLLSIILTLVIPESPKWLASKSRWMEAAKTLSRIRTVKSKTHKNDKSYVTRAYTNGKKIRFCGYHDLFTRKYWRATISGIVLHLVIQLTSTTTLMYYFSYICDMCGVDQERKYLFISSQYIILGISTIVPVILLDNARRIDFMSYGLLVISFTFIAKFVILEIFAVPVEESDSPFNWVINREPASAIIALFLFLVSVYSSSITSVSWVFTGEIFPDEARAKGTATCMCVSWMINGLTTLILPLSFKLAEYYVFLILGCLCFIGTICVSQLPETKVKTTQLSGLTISSEVESDFNEDEPLASESISEEKQALEILNDLSTTLIKSGGTSDQKAVLSPFIDSPLFKLTNKSNDIIVESEEEDFTKSLYENMKSNYESPTKTVSDGDDTIGNVIQSYSADFKSPTKIESSRNTPQSNISLTTSSLSDWNVKISNYKKDKPRSKTTNKYHSTPNPSSEDVDNSDLPDEPEWYRFDNLRKGPKNNLQNQSTVRRSQNLFRS
ncbi:hypothetical protein CLIB1444_21S01178 [[Candida] jaroonii]|uniref:Uncharacterized protein n=1 Tax=[Candida] jaroonii TaxID=467808 RepID=A0ACA9YGL5_9ASCO|nr:hypothetical protein CLIB1444_21S01178 [[Candida] jaroonii]